MGISGELAEYFNDWVAQHVPCVPAIAWAYGAVGSHGGVCLTRGNKLVQGLHAINYLCGEFADEGSGSTNVVFSSGILVPKRKLDENYNGLIAILVRGRSYCENNEDTLEAMYKVSDLARGALGVEQEAGSRDPVYAISNFNPNSPRDSESGLRVFEKISIGSPCEKN